MRGYRQSFVRLPQPTHVLEMSADANREAIERVARQFIERNGADAVLMLRELADAAEDIHDDISAKAWRDIADVAERLLRG